MTDAARYLKIVEWSDADAFVVEQGIFCYVAAPCEGELVRLIHAATHAADVEAICKS